MCLLVNIYCLLSLLYLGGPSFLLRFEYSLCSSLTITGSVRGSFQVSRMDNKGKICWDNGIINVISVKKENRDEASIFKRHRSWLFNPVYVLCNRVEVWDRLMLPVLLFLCVVLYHGVSQQQPARHSNGWNKADISCYHCLILTIKLCWKQSLPEYRIQNTECCTVISNTEPRISSTLRSILPICQHYHTRVPRHCGTEGGLSWLVIKIFGSL